jgi:hypothetical protein
MDGKMIDTYKTDYSNFTADGVWSVGGDFLGVGSYKSPTLFQTIEVTEVSGPGSTSAEPASPANPTPLASAVNGISPGHPRVVNLMSLIDVKKDAVGGVWKSDSDGITSDANGNARLRIPYDPPAEYDLHFVFVRESGNNAVAAILSHGGHAFDWQMGALSNAYCGFETRDAAYDTKNPSVVKIDPSLTNGKRCDCVVQVRNDSVTAYMDGKLVSRYGTDYADVSLYHYWSLKADNAIGIGSGSSPTLFQMIEVTEVSGAGSAATRPVDSKPESAP